MKAANTEFTYEVPEHGRPHDVPRRAQRAHTVRRARVEQRHGLRGEGALHVRAASCRSESGLRARIGRRARLRARVSLARGDRHARWPGHRVACRRRRRPRRRRRRRRPAPTVTVGGHRGRRPRAAGRRPRRAGPLRARANRRGARRPGAPIEYAGAARSPTPRPRHASPTAFAVVPAVGDRARSVDLRARERLPFVGVATAPSGTPTRGASGSSARRPRCGRRRGAPRGACSCVRCSGPRRARRSRSSSTPTRSGATEPRRPPPRSARRASRSRLRSRCRRRRRAAARPRARSSPAIVAAAARDRLLLTTGADAAGHRAAARAARLHRHRRRRRSAVHSRPRRRSAQRPHRARAHRAVRADTAGEPPHGRRRRGVRAGTVLTPAVAAGYWSPPTSSSTCSGDVGKQLTARALRRGRERRSTSPTRCPARSAVRTWPAMHTQGVPCGALGAERRHAVPRGRALPVRQADRPISDASVDARRVAAQSPSSRRNPTFIVTWYQRDRAVVHRAADVGDLEPVEVAQGLRRARRCRCGSRRRCPSGDEPTISVIL